MNQDINFKNKRKRMGWLPLILAACLAIAVFTPIAPLVPVPSAMANTGTVIRAVASPSTVSINGIVTVDIMIDNVSNLYGAEFHLSYNRNLLQVQDADPAKSGTQIEVGSLLPIASGFVAVNRADNVAGKIDFGITRLNPASPISSSGRLARIQFKALANGTATIHFTTAILANRNGGVIPFTTQDVQIVIGASPRWATAGWLWLEWPETKLCTSEPKWVTIAGKATLSPRKSQAILESEYYTFYPNDRRTDPHYDYKVVRDGERFTFQVYWPGIRPQDTLVIVQVHATLLDEEGDRIMRFPIVFYLPCVHMVNRHDRDND